MTAALVGSLNAGQLNPLSLQALGSAGAQLSANLTAALQLQVQASIGAPPLSVQLANVEAAALVLEAGISAGLPGVTFSVSQAAALVASARAALGILADLTALLNGPAMFVYSYASNLGNIGTDLASAITATPPFPFVGGSPTAGLLIGASPGDWSTINPYFGGI
jgi:hypothetical protein